MELDELLNHESTVPDLSPAARQHTRETLIDAVTIDIARRAKIIRLRRTRTVLIGVAAAAVTGVVGVAVVSQPGSRPAPTTTPAVQSKAPTVIQFKTVAQVISAASAATDKTNPTDAPYWKVITATTCGNATPSGTCEITIWTGNRRPGAIKNGIGEVMATCAGTVTIDGHTMPWATANTRHWSAADVATIVADNGSNKPGRPPHSYYIFKNSIEILGGTPASPAIRKQLWKELAAILGVKLEGRQKDTLGRTGWLLTLPNTRQGYATQSILVDTSTGTLLQESDQATGDSANVSTIVSAGPSDTVPAATPGALKAVC